MGGGRFSAPTAQSDLDKAKNAKTAKNHFFTTYVDFFPGFGENNVESAIASFCLVFRAFWQITVGGGGGELKNHPVQVLCAKVLHASYVGQANPKLQPLFWPSTLQYVFIQGVKKAKQKWS